MVERSGQADQLHGLRENEDDGDQTDQPPEQRLLVHGDNQQGRRGEGHDHHQPAPERRWIGVEGYAGGESNEQAAGPGVAEQKTQLLGDRFGLPAALFQQQADDRRSEQLKNGDPPLGAQEVGIGTRAMVSMLVRSRAISSGENWV